MPITRTRIIYGATYQDSEDANMDLRWMIKMRLPDAHFFFEFGHENGRVERVLFASSLEYSRAQKEARNCRVIPYERYLKKLGTQDIGLAVQYFLKERDVDTLELHPSTPMRIAVRLRQLGFTITMKETPWYAERIAKTKEEIGWILEVQRNVEKVVGMVQERLAKAAIRRNIVMEGKKPLTSEMLRKFIEDELFKRGCVFSDTIVSSGKRAACPHDLGSGSIKAHSPIICDVFPYSRETGYFADMTRTFVKGSPSTLLVRVYGAVLEGQLLGIDMIRAGIDGKTVHQKIFDLFQKRGFRTDYEKGFGFIHGTGHGLGLRCHEPPARINRQSHILPKGLVISVEPGLYYPDEEIGVRIEDLVQVTRTGCRNLTTYPKQLKDIVIP